MSERISLLDMLKTTELNGKNVKIALIGDKKVIFYENETWVSRGGTCLVYLCRLVDKANPELERKVILKEFYPILHYRSGDERIRRASDGTMVVPRTVQEQSEEYIVKKNRFEESYNSFTSLPNEEELNRYVVQSLDKVYANETTYIFVEYTAMSVFSDYFEKLNNDNNISEAKKLYEVFVAVKKAAEVINKLHSFGCCHLDITPSNLFFHSESADENSIKLLDLDSCATEEEMEEGRFFLSCSDGYTAPEIIEMKGKTKNEIGNFYFYDGVKADIFSLGAILYQYVMGTKLDIESVNRNNQKELDEDKVFRLLEAHMYQADLREEVLKKNSNCTTETLTGITKCIFKCINRNPENRYKDINELIKDLANIMKNMDSTSFETRSSELLDIIYEITEIETPKFRLGAKTYDIEKCPVTKYTFGRLCDKYIREKGIGSKIQYLDKAFEEQIKEEVEQLNEQLLSQGDNTLETEGAYKFNWNEKRKIIVICGKEEKEKNDRGIDLPKETKCKLTSHIERIYEEKKKLYIEKLNELIWDCEDKSLQSFLCYEFIWDEKRKVVVLSRRNEIKEDVEICNFGMDPIEVLKKLNDVYNELSFHENYDAVENREKKEINITISEYIRALAFAGVFSEEKDKKALLLEICRNQVEKHNHDNNYIYALVENDLKTGMPLICVPSREAVFYEQSDVNQILEIIGKYYEDVFKTDGSFVYFGDKVIEWLKLSEDKGFVNRWLKKYISDYKSYDQAIWGIYIVSASKNINYLRNYISDNILTRCKFIGMQQEYIEARHHATGFLSLLGKGKFKELCVDRNNTKYAIQLIEYISVVLDNIHHFNVSAVGAMAQGIKICLLNLVGSEEYKSKIENMLKDKNIFDENKMLRPVKEVYDTIFGEDNNKQVQLIDKQGIGDYSTAELMSLIGTDDGDKLLPSLVEQISREKNSLEVKYPHLNVCEFYEKALKYIIQNNIQVRCVVFADIKKCPSTNVQEMICEYCENIIVGESLFELDINEIQSCFRKVRKKSYIYKKVLDFVANNVKKLKYQSICIIFCILEGYLREIIYKWSKYASESNEEMEAILRITRALLNSNNNGLERAYIATVFKVLLEQDILMQLPKDIRKMILCYVNNKYEYYSVFSNVVRNFDADEFLWNQLDDCEKWFITQYADRYINIYNSNANINNFLLDVMDVLNKKALSGSQIYEKYGTNVDVLMCHIIRLFKYRPDITSYICAISISKFLNNMKYRIEEDNIGLNYDSERYENRKRLLDQAILNPCIYDFAVKVSKEIAYQRRNKRYLSLLSNSNTECIRRIIDEDKKNIDWFDLCNSDAIINGDGNVFQEKVDIQDIEIPCMEQEAILIGSVNRKAKEANIALCEWAKNTEKEPFCPPQEVILFKCSNESTVKCQDNKKYKIVSGTEYVRACIPMKGEADGLFPKEIIVTIIEPNQHIFSKSNTFVKPKYIGININDYLEEIVFSIKEAVENKIPYEERDMVLTGNDRKYKISRNIYISEELCVAIREYINTYNIYNGTLKNNVSAAYGTLIAVGRGIMKKLCARQVRFKAYTVAIDGNEIGKLCVSKVKLEVKSTKIHGNKKIYEEYIMYLSKDEYTEKKSIWKSREEVTSDVKAMLKIIDCDEYKRNGSYKGELYHISECFMKSSGVIYVYDSEMGYTEFDIGEYGYYADVKNINYDKKIQEAIKFYNQGTADDKQLARAIGKAYKQYAGRLVEKVINAIGKDAIVYDMVLGITKDKPISMAEIIRLVPVCNSEYMHNIFEY